MHNTYVFCDSMRMTFFHMPYGMHMTCYGMSYGVRKSLSYDMHMTFYMSYGMRMTCDVLCHTLCV